MKQFLFVLAVTLAGSVGVFAASPFWGVATYYMFAILRPQFIWEWALPADVQWSRYIAVATIIGMLLQKRTSQLARAPRIVYLYFAWIVLTYFTARERDFAWPYFNEYLKIFIMYYVSEKIISRVKELWWLLCMSALTLGYIAVDVNHLYLSAGYLTLYKRGYGGLDNNGAGLMLAMGIPLCVAVWDGMLSRWRWAVMALVPFLLHAVITTYSRGAMLSLVVTSPLILIRCRRRSQIAGLIAATVVFALPVMAGPEIRDRFFTISEHDKDESANSRKQSWYAALHIAFDNPILGVGVRNANLFSYQYGADMEGRTIHSQYFQIAADNGFVGLGLYLATWGSVWACTRRARRWAAGRNDSDALSVHAVAMGAEGAMAVFCFGGIFLSLENFELPYLIMLLSTQTAKFISDRPRPAITPIAPEK